jgi:hypothetical protein
METKKTKQRIDETKMSSLKDWQSLSQSDEKKMREDMDKQN